MEASCWRIGVLNLTSQQEHSHDRPPGIAVSHWRASVAEMLPS
jgi:hypothetical protein